MNELAEQPELFPLMRGGGVFLAAVGLGIVAGAFGGRRWRTAALIAGAVLGVVAMAVLGIAKLAFAGVGHPAVWQWVVLGCAFLVEALLVSVVVRRIPDTGSRRFWLWMLIAVGAHFLILLPSHGAICGGLALVCIANASLGLRLTGVDVRVFWAVDGVLKIAAGVAMVLISLV
jgi:hypothetical protein